MNEVELHLWMTSQQEQVAQGLISKFPGPPARRCNQHHPL
jgi:hypothetical protein